MSSSVSPPWSCGGCVFGGHGKAGEKQARFKSISQGRVHTGGVALTRPEVQHRLADRERRRTSPRLGSAPQTGNGQAPPPCFSHRAGEQGRRVPATAGGIDANVQLEFVGMLVLWARAAGPGGRRGARLGHRRRPGYGRKVNAAAGLRRECVVCHGLVKVRSKRCRVVLPHVDVVWGSTTSGVHASHER